MKQVKVTQTCTRNTPSSACVYSITVTTTYSSFNKSEIDEIEKMFSTWEIEMPKGMIVMDTDKPQRMVDLK